MTPPSCAGLADACSTWHGYEASNDRRFDRWREARMQFRGGVLMGRSELRFVVAVFAVLLAGCAAPAMTPAQQEARELRDYCQRVTTQDMARCAVFFGTGGP